jgi:hypothetical protein
VAEIIHAWWDGDHDGLLTNTESRRVFLPGGKVPETGEMFRNPDVARALTLVANQGETAFYRGDVAKAILKTSDELGGTMTADDLASYSAEWVEPISTKYRDWTVYELPPNGDGIAALEMLNIMEQFKPDPAGPHGPDELHTRIEAMKLAYADVKEYDGDPRFSKIPVDQRKIWSIWKRAANWDVPSMPISRRASRSTANIPHRAHADRYPKDATRVDRMKRKLQTKPGRAVYATRKTIVEPVFGQIKQARGFRQFLLRGLAKVRGEWALVCLTHNILKLHRLCSE